MYSSTRVGTRISGCADLLLHRGEGVWCAEGNSSMVPTLVRKIIPKAISTVLLSKFLTFLSVSSIFLLFFPEKKTKLVSSAKTKVKPQGLTFGNRFEDGKILLEMKG